MADDKFDDLPAEAKETGLMLVELIKDCIALSSLIGSPCDNPCNRRAYVRALFAQIEADIFVQKQGMLKDTTGFSEAEIAMLREETYSIDRGKARIQTKFISIEDNFRFVLAMRNRNAKDKYQESFDGEGWHSLKKAIEIRNRLTHPKELADLTVSDSDMTLIRKAGFWVTRCSINAMVHFWGKDSLIGKYLAKECQNVLVDAETAA